MRVRTVLLVLVALGGVGHFGAWRLGASRQAQWQEGIDRSRTRAWARAEGGAGPSVLPKRIPLAHEAELRELEDLPGFHEFAMRCSSCHELPDPAAYPAELWIGKVNVMRQHIRRAGVMPPAETELQAAQKFLRLASDSLRRDRMRDE